MPLGALVYAQEIAAVINLHGNVQLRVSAEAYRDMQWQRKLTNLYIIKKSVIPNY